MNYRLLICSLLVLSWGCDDDLLVPDGDRIGLDFFPLQKGLFRTYDVEQIDFTVISSDTNHFQLREVVVDSFLNVENDFTYILHRFIRASDTLEWELDSVWTARRTGSFAVVIENNIPIIKLVFPPDGGKEWDGNSLNDRQSQIFRMTDVDLPFTLNDTVFQNTLTVIQSEVEDNLIEQDERKEVFARGIGLVHKDFVVLDFCARDDCLGEGIIDAGQIKRLNLIDYGKE